MENCFEQDHLLVRGRCEKDILNLQKLISEKEDLQMLRIPGNDYRLNAPKDVWGRICQKLAAGIDYHNFKGYVHGDPA